MKTGFLFATLMLSLSVNASDWRRISADEKAMLDIDYSSISTRGEYRKAWFRWLYATSQQIPLGSIAYNHERASNAYDETTSLSFFSCKQRSILTAQVVYYVTGEKGTETVSSWATPMSPAALTDVAPDSLGETMLQIVCGKKLN